MTVSQLVICLVGVLGLGISNLLSHAEQLLLFSILLGGMALALIRTCGLWDCRTLFFATSSLYVMAGPVDVLLVVEPSDLDPNASFQAMRFGFLFLLSSLFSMLSVRRTSQNIEVAPLPFNWRAAALLMFGSVTIYIDQVADGPGLIIGELSRAEVGMAQNWFIAVLRFFIYVQILYLTMTIGARSENTAPSRGALATLTLTLISFLLVELFVLGDRRMLVMMMLGAGIALFMHQTRVRHLLIGVVLVPMLSLYTLVRNSPLDLWGEVIAAMEFADVVAPRNIEFGAYALVASTLLTDPPMDFPSYLQTLPQLIPQFLLDKRPDAPSQWFVQTYFPEIASIGGGLAFNFVLEVYLNAGLVGLFLAGSLVGLCLRYASIGRYRQVLNPIAGALFVFLMRLDLVSLLRSLFIMAAMFVCVWCVYRIVCSWGHRSYSIDGQRGTRH